MKSLNRFLWIVAVCAAIAFPARPGFAQAGVPALRVIAPNGATSVLIGSMHIPYDGLRQPDASIFEGAKRYVVEHSMAQGPQPKAKGLEEVLAPEVLRHLMTTGTFVRADWARSLTDEQVAQLRRNQTCLTGAQLAEAFLPFMLGSRSAAAANVIAWAPCASPGLLSRDTILQRLATARRIPTETLETHADVDARRQAVPERLHLQSLKLAFTSIAPKAFARTVDALNTGDYDAITDAVRQTSGTDPEDVELAYRVMVTERNQAWIPTLMRYLDEGQALINVGAAHLPGQDGVISLLKARGYRVEPVLLPAGDPRGGPDGL